MNTTCHCCNSGFQAVSFYFSRLNSVFSVWWERLFYLKLCLALDLPLNLGSISHIWKISKLTLLCIFHSKTLFHFALWVLKSPSSDQMHRPHSPAPLPLVTSGLSCLLYRSLLLLLLLSLSSSHAVWLFQGSPGDTVLLSSLTDRHGQNESSPVLLTARLCPPGGLAGRISVTAGRIGLHWLWQLSSLLIH